MASLLSPGDLSCLHKSESQRDGFGPGSQREYLLVDLREGCPHEMLVDENLSLWLKGLPCPVLVVAAPGQSRLLSCDVAVTAISDLSAVIATITEAPITSMIFVQLLRLVEQLPLEQALVAESLAYATLQVGGEFRHWLASRGSISPACSGSGSPLQMTRMGEHLSLSLNRPENRNAVNIEMRDALVEAFEMACIDDSITRVTLDGIGQCFSVGGDFREFGQTTDAAVAHWVRSIRMPGYFLARCAEKVTAHVHGACIGSGIEIPAFSCHLTAARKTFFQLPEIRMGLIPGAGGCVSISRRIGRQKMAYMALSARRINADVALSWGLIDAIID